MQQYILINNIETPFKKGMTDENRFVNFKQKNNLIIKKVRSVEFAKRKVLNLFIMRNYLDTLRKIVLKKCNLNQKTFGI